MVIVVLILSGLSLFFLENQFNLYSKIYENPLSVQLRGFLISIGNKYSVVIVVGISLGTLYRALESLELTPADILSSIQSKDDIELVLKYKKNQAYYADVAQTLKKHHSNLSLFDIELLLEGGENKDD